MLTAYSFIILSLQVSLFCSLASINVSCAALSYMNTKPTDSPIYEYCSSPRATPTNSTIYLCRERVFAVFTTFLSATKKRARIIKKRKTYYKKKKNLHWAVVFVRIFSHFCGEWKGEIAT